MFGGLLTPELSREYTPYDPRENLDDNDDGGAPSPPPPPPSSLPSAQPQEEATVCVPVNTDAPGDDAGGIGGGREYVSNASSAAGTGAAAAAVSGGGGVPPAAELQQRQRGQGQGPQRMLANLKAKLRRNGNGNGNDNGSGKKDTASGGEGAVVVGPGWAGRRVVAPVTPTHNNATPFPQQQQQQQQQSRSQNTKKDGEGADEAGRRAMNKERRRWPVRLIILLVFLWLLLMQAVVSTMAPDDKKGKRVTVGGKGTATSALGRPHSRRDRRSNATTHTSIAAEAVGTAASSHDSEVDRQGRPGSAPEALPLPPVTSAPTPATTETPLPPKEQQPRAALAARHSGTEAASVAPYTAGGNTSTAVTNTTTTTTTTRRPVRPLRKEIFGEDELLAAFEAQRRSRVAVGGTFTLVVAAALDGGWGATAAGNELRLERLLRRLHRYGVTRHPRLEGVLVALTPRRMRTALVPYTREEVELWRGHAGRWLESEERRLQSALAACPLSVRLPHSEVLEGGNATTTTTSDADDDGTAFRALRREQIRRALMADDGAAARSTGALQFMASRPPADGGASFFSYSPPLDVMEAVGAVTSEYALVTTLDWVPYHRPGGRAGPAAGGGGQDAPPPPSPACVLAYELVEQMRHTQEQLTVAMQSLSNNGLGSAGMPLAGAAGDASFAGDEMPVVVDEDPDNVGLSVAADVHRLHLGGPSGSGDHTAEDEYYTADQLDAALKAFVNIAYNVSGALRTLQDDSLLPAPPATRRSPPREAEAEGERRLELEGPPPEQEYGHHARYHCARAPLYDTAAYVPPLLLAPPLPPPVPRSLSTPSSSAARPYTRPTPHYSASSLKRTSSSRPPPLTTLCHVLLSRASRMQHFTGPQTRFADLYCDRWREWTTPATTQELGSGVTAVLEPHSLCDGVCGLEWATQLKRSWLALRGRPPPPPVSAHRPLAIATSASTAAPLPSTTTPTAAAAAAPPPPPLTPLLQYAALTLRDLSKAGGAANTTGDRASVDPLASSSAAAAPLRQRLQQALAPHALQKLERTFFPAERNATAAVERLQHTLVPLLRDRVSVRRVVPNPRRRANKRSSSGSSGADVSRDPRVACFTSADCGWSLAPAMYRTRWFLAHVAGHCLRFPKQCVGAQRGFAGRIAPETADLRQRRAADHVNSYITSSAGWRAGKFVVCVADGAFVKDPLGSLPL